MNPAPMIKYDSMENGYGQYVDLDPYNVNDTVIDIHPEPIDSSTEYNKHLDKLEHSLDYGPPMNVYMNHNMVVPVNADITSFTNPLFTFVTYIVGLTAWLKR